MGFIRLFVTLILLPRRKKRYELLVSQKATESKRLNLGYSYINDRPPYSQSADGTVQLSINDQNGITAQLLKEKYSAMPAFDDANSLV